MEAGQRVDEYTIGAGNHEVDSATRCSGPITQRVSDIEGNSGIRDPLNSDTRVISSPANGSSEIRNAESAESVRIEPSRTTQPTRNVNTILSTNDFPDCPEYQDTPPNTFGYSPMIPSEEDRSISNEGRERQHKISEGPTQTESVMTPPRSRPHRACRKATMERATSQESPHRISARRSASPKRSRSRANSITVSSPPSSRRNQRTRPRASPTPRVTGSTRSATRGSNDVPTPYADDIDYSPYFPMTPQDFPPTPPDSPIVPLTYDAATTFSTLSEEVVPPSTFIERELTHLFVTFPLSRNLDQLPNVRINVTLGSHDGVVIESHLITGSEGQEVQVIIPRLLLNAGNELKIEQVKHAN